MTTGERRPNVTTRMRSISRPGRSSRSGFSIIELLVAIIIIGILVLIILPVISNRTEQARVARVNADLEHLAEAMERQAIDTGYYVRLFALNDVYSGDGVAFNRGTNNDVADGLTDYTVSNPFYQFNTSNSLFINISTGDFANVDRADLIARLGRSETRYDGSIGWNGPYINWRRDENLYNNVLGPTGIPDDPWGNDYLFFTRRGLLLEPDGEFVTSASPAVGGGLTGGGTFETDVFDRPTIVSLGPNGLPGDGLPTAGPEFGRGDDFYRSFGR